MLLPGATLSYYGEEIGLLEMTPDDDTIAKYTSQMGQAVCSIVMYKSMSSETFMTFYVKLWSLLQLLVMNVYASFIVLVA